MSINPIVGSPDELEQGVGRCMIESESVSLSQIDQNTYEYVIQNLRVYGLIAAGSIQTGYTLSIPDLNEVLVVSMARTAQFQLRPQIRAQVRVIIVPEHFLIINLRTQIPPGN